MTRCQTDTSCQSSTISDTDRSHALQSGPGLIVTNEVPPIETKGSMAAGVTTRPNSNAWPLKCEHIGNWVTETTLYPTERDKRDAETEGFFTD